MALCWEDGLEAKGGLACIYNTITIGFQTHDAAMQMQQQ